MDLFGKAFNFVGDLFGGEGDDLLMKGLEYGYDYLTQDDDYNFSSQRLKRLRGRVPVATSKISAATQTKAPTARVTTTYDVVYNKYNGIFKRALAEAKATTRRG